MQEYLTAGTVQVWFVFNRTKTVQVYRQSEESITLRVGDALEGGDLLPGFRLPLADLFKDRPTG